MCVTCIGCLQNSVTHIGCLQNIYMSHIECVSNVCHMYRVSSKYSVTHIGCLQNIYMSHIEYVSNVCHMKSVSAMCVTYLVGLQYVSHTHNLVRESQEPVAVFAYI